MKMMSRAVLKAACLSFALVGSTSIAVSLIATDTAWAKNPNNNGKGNGNSGNAKGNSGGNGNGHGNGNKKESSGAPASALGALNAAHANANALLHANPNSRVGRIAVFRDAVLETQGIEAERDAAQEILDGLPEPERSSQDVQAEIDLTNIARDGIEAEIAQLEADKLVEGANIADIDAAILAKEGELDGIDLTLADLGDELGDATAWEEAADAVSDLEDALALRPAVERELLEAAANKPVTDDVEAAVEELLGLN